MTLRVVVADDEPLPRQRIRDLVSQHPSLTLAGEATNGTEALDVLVELRPDLVFLDIQMPELDGLQVAASLGEEDTPPAIVFVTAFDEYAIRAFEVDAIDYLLKPVTPERFTAAVDRVLKRLDRDDVVAARADSGVGVADGDGSRLRDPVRRAARVEALLRPGGGRRLGRGGRELCPAPDGRDVAPRPRDDERAGGPARSRTFRAHPPVGASSRSITFSRSRRGSTANIWSRWRTAPGWSRAEGTVTG